MQTKTTEERELERKARIVDQAGKLFGYSKPKPYDSDLWLYEENRKFIKHRLDLEDDRHYDLLAAGVLHSYRVRENRSTPYVFCHGPTGTGKNRILQLLTALCKDGFIVGNTTSAALYVIMDTHHPTLGVDEAEKLAPYGRKNQSESTQAILEVLNMGYLQDQLIPRVDKDSGLLRFYDPFGFKIIASTETLPDPLLGRCIVINTEENVDTSIPVSFDRTEGKELRDYLAYYAGKYEQGSAWYKPPEKSLTLDDLKMMIPNYRVVETFGPLYRVTPEPKAQAHILELAKEAADDRAQERGSGADAQILEALIRARDGDWNVEKKKYNIDRYPIGVITKLFNEGREKWETQSADSIGRRIRKFGLKPCRTHGGIRGVLWDEKRLARRFKRYGLSFRACLKCQSVTALAKCPSCNDDTAQPEPEPPKASPERVSG